MGNMAPFSGGKAAGAWN